MVLLVSVLTLPIGTVVDLIALMSCDKAEHQKCADGGEGAHPAIFLHNSSFAVAFAARFGAVPAYLAIALLGGVPSGASEKKPENDCWRRHTLAGSYSALARCVARDEVGPRALCCVRVRVGVLWVRARAVECEIGGGRPRQREASSSPSRDLARPLVSPLAPRDGVWSLAPARSRGVRDRRRDRATRRLGRAQVRTVRSLLHMAPTMQVNGQNGDGTFWATRRLMTRDAVLAWADEREAALRAAVEDGTRSEYAAALSWVKPGW